MRVKFVRYLAFAVVFGLLGCSSTQAPVPPPQSAPSSLQGDTVTIHGRLTNPKLMAAAGSNVSLYEIHNDGRLVPTPGRSIAVDQDGRFTIDVVLNTAQVSDLLVRADSELGYGLVVVPTNLVVDKSIPASPINDETTVEAQIYLAAKASGIWPADATMSRLHGLISARLAHLTLHDKDYSQAMGILGRAASAATQSWQAVLTNAAVGVRPDQLRTTFAALDWSHLTLAAGLNTAHGVEEEEMARADFEAGVPLVYGLASIRPFQLAAAAQATAETFELYARLLHGQSQSQALVDMEVLRASYVTEMINETFYACASQPARQRAKALGDGLLLRLANAAAGQADPGAVKSTLHAAWGDYRKAIEAGLQDCAAGIAGVNWQRTMDAVRHEAEDSGRQLSKLDASAPPTEVADRAGHLMAAVYSSAALQTGSFSSANQPRERARAQALLIALGNLAVAAR